MQPSSLSDALLGFNTMEPDLWDYREDIQNLSSFLAAGAETEGVGALVEAVGNLDTYRGEDSVRYWLHAFVSCESLRVRGLDEPDEVNEYLDSVVFSPAEKGSKPPPGTDDELRLRKSLFDVFAALPDNYRAALLLKEGHGLTVNQCARLTDSTPAAIRSILFRARARIKEASAR